MKERIVRVAMLSCAILAINAMALDTALVNINSSIPATSNNISNDNTTAYNIILNSVEERVMHNSVEDTEVQDTEGMAPRLALTFDDGPSDMEGGTEYLLDGLAARGVVATFFVLGSRAKANPLIMERLYEEGHLIGNHTYNHVDLSEVSDEVIVEELTSTNAVIEAVTGEPVLFMRPPYGSWDPEDEDLFQMIPVLWTVDSLDWTTSNIEEIVNKVVTDVEENDIILMHDCYQSSTEAAFQIIDILQAEGYEFVTVDELLLE